MWSHEDHSKPEIILGIRDVVKTSVLTRAGKECKRNRNVKMTESQFIVIIIHLLLLLFFVFLFGKLAAFRELSNFGSCLGSSTALLRL